jgi:hypothetical protein
MVEGDILPSHPTVIRVQFTSSKMYTLYENICQTINTQCGPVYTNGRLCRLHRAYVRPTKLFMLAHRSQMTLHQRQFAHRAFVGMCWFNVGPMCLIYWAYIGSLFAFSQQWFLCWLFFIHLYIYVGSLMAQCKKSLAHRWPNVVLDRSDFGMFSFVFQRKN